MSWHREGKGMLMISTRLAHEHDVRVVFQLFRELDQFHADGSPTYFQVPEPSQLTPEELIHAMHDPKHLVLLAIVHDPEETIVGVAFAQLEEEPAVATSLFRPRQLCWIHKLVIAQPYRGKGIGHHLMEQVEHWTLQHGVYDIELLVWAFNSGGKSFYEDVGYAPRNVVLGKTLRSDPVRIED